MGLGCCSYSMGDAFTQDAWVQDAAIAHGYNNIDATVPQCVTAGQEVPINELSELLRGEVR